MMTKGSLRPATIRRDSVCINELHTPVPFIIGRWRA
jgi:hypothetical protein